MKAKGDTFKTIRENNKITQSQIAKYLNVDQSLISKFESNERVLSIDLLEKSADLFGCSVRVFFENDFSKPELKTAFRIAGSNLLELEDMAMINRIAMNLSMLEELDKE